MANLPPKDTRVFRVADQGHLTVPRDVLAAVGLEPKMHVRFRVEDKTLVVERVAAPGDVLEGPLGRKVDRDLFGKVQAEQERELERLRDRFDKGISDAAKDEEPPDHPFRWD
jgi:bifunctional DNA-binding transcriptional regulator/antitoxin component of YhaV-PrlF toxin-antitoxin module